MSDENRGDLRPPRQHGTTWRESEYRILADDLRAGADLARTAITVGRTESAVRTALRNFVPPEDRVPTAERERWIRTRLVAEPEWDWWAVVVEHHRRSRSGLWFTRHEHCARIGWRRRTPMPALAQELATSELSVAELLRALGLVESIEEAADRLGATPGLALAKRVTARRDEAVGARWILVVDGAAGTTRPRNAPVRRQLSLHVTRAEAEAERDRILSWHNRIGPDETDATVWWTIAERGLGATVGHTRCGTYDATGTGGRIRAEALTVGDVIRVPVPDGGFLQDRITAITRSAASASIVVDLAPVANSRVRRVVEFAADEVVDVVRREEQHSAPRAVAEPG
ncbi:hypothetical protein [Nocardia alba]|uniref:Uncharacterized protein n=1 Tax=Nocardia alba TaxID=225051 RepID=A0A4R1G0X6_9NOCA|nr:hypothetical protein [Nocardia alba]TCJ97291.1 hypothetical protein DFR71_3333 [Nocardia alba]